MNSYAYCRQQYDINSLDVYVCRCSFLEFGCVLGSGSGWKQYI